MSAERRRSGVSRGYNRSLSSYSLHVNHSIVSHAY